MASLRTFTLLLLAPLVLAACSSSVADPLDWQDDAFAKAPDKADRPIYRGTPKMRAVVAEALARAPKEDDAGYLRIRKELIELGEPAVAPLLIALRDPDPVRRRLACDVLGMRRDARAHDALAGRLKDDEARVRYEAATALVRGGDRRGIDTLLEGLASEDALVRHRAVQVLRETTGESFGFVANARPVDREAALARWRQWRARLAPRSR